LSFTVSFFNLLMPSLKMTTQHMA